jgi:iron(III) transport system permease protein
MSEYRFLSKKLNIFVVFCILLTLLPFPYLINIVIKGQLYLPDYLIKPLAGAFINGLWLCIVTCFFSVLWAVPAALVLTLYDIRHKKIWLSVLILPIAIPSYLNAYVYSYLLYYTSDLAIWYRHLTGNLMPFNIHSNIGGAFVLSLSLYPYILFPLYQRLKDFPPNIFDYARTIGHKKIIIILQSVLRSSMPVIIFGMALISLETLADYGTVSYYGIDAPSRFLLDIWQQTGDITIAVNITVLFLCMTVLIFFVSNYYQKNKTYNNTKSTGYLKPFKIKNKISLLCINLWLGLIFLITFLIPVLFFVYYFLLTPLPKIDFLLDLTVNSFTPAMIAAILCVVVGFIFSFYHHHGHNKYIKLVITLCCSGYAFPSVILGIAVYTSLLSFNRWFNDIFDIHLMLVSGSLIGLIMCYYIKFLTVSYGGLTPVFKIINPSLLQSTIVSGYDAMTASRLIYGHFFKKPIMIALVLVIVDSIKELPATLLLRPFGFETFATFTYNMAGLERIPEASSAALILIFMGVCATLFPIVTHIIKTDNAS